jgi:class 3 adenylate cyclase
MTTLPDLRVELSDEVGTILARDFTVTATKTNIVPHSSDGAITFPNLDTKTQACKLIDTCVLYIDIRHSTELSIAHKPETVAKLYSAFVRAMTKCARHYDGHVRGIIGDRVMVIFDHEDCFRKSVDCAILMNSTAKYVINKYFKKNEVKCGIGIDAGKMLVTKTGFRRRGIENHNYKNLVWLGHPANIASKLTDIANKPSEGIECDIVCVAYQNAVNSELYWTEVWPSQFAKDISSNLLNRLTHFDPKYRTHYMTSKYIETRAATKPILMTERVHRGLKAGHPKTAGFFTNVILEVPGYSGAVYGGDVNFKAFSE